MSFSVFSTFFHSALGMKGRWVTNEENFPIKSWVKLGSTGRLHHKTFGHSRKTDYHFLEEKERGLF